MAFNQRTISHVFFDHDGTLVDTEHLAIEAMLEVLAPYGFSMSADEYSQRFPGLIDRHIVELIRRDMHLDIPEFDVIRDDLRRRHRILFQERLEGVKGMPELFRQLNASKSIVSNASRPHIDFCTQKTGIYDAVNGAIFSVEMVEHPKPAPDLYALALTTFQLHPEQAIVIEDSPTGVLAAKAAGIRTVGFLGAAHVGNGHRDELLNAGADHIASDAPELKSIFESLGIR